MSSKKTPHSVPANNKTRRTSPLTVIALTIIISLVFFGMAGFWGLRHFGRTDVLSRIPVVGRYFPAKTEAAKSPEEELAAAREELEAEKVALAAAQAAVAQEKQSLEALRAELDAREQALAKAEAELAAASARHLSEQESIKRLARLAANMPAENAVPILENLGDALVVEVLAALSEKDGAAILAAMDPQNAARLMQKMHE